MSKHAKGSNFRQIVDWNMSDNLQEQVSRSWRSDPQNPDPSQGWSHEIIWRYADGRVDRVGGRLSALLLPAEPGLEVVFIDHCCPAGSDVAYCETRQPVIGWELAYDDSEAKVFVPLVPLNAGHQYMGVLWPDGRVSEVWREKTFLSVNEFIESTRAAERENLERASARARPCHYCGNHHEYTATGTTPDDSLPF
jgi:hypothetical protein